MVREAKTNKILVLGVDGMDPRLTKKFMDQGKLPHIKEYVEKGACREDYHFNPLLFLVIKVLTNFSPLLYL